MTVVRGAGAGEAVPALAGGWPLQGQELSELPFSVPGPSTPQEKGNRGTREGEAARGQLFVIWICKEKGGGRE